MKKREEEKCVFQKTKDSKHFFQKRKNTKNSMMKYCYIKHAKKINLQKIVIPFIRITHFFLSKTFFFQIFENFDEKKNE